MIKINNKQKIYLLIKIRMISNIIILFIKVKLKSNININFFNKKNKKINCLYLRLCLNITIKMASFLEFVF